MVYLDANVFVLATLGKDSLGDAARHILANLKQIDAKTCCLTMDELAWVVLRKVDNATSIKACKAVLMLPDLDIVSVEYGDMWKMTELMDTFELKPRDALHLAIMERLGEKTIVTEDTHFDKAQVQKIQIKTYAKSI